MKSLYNTLKESLLSGFEEIEVSTDPKKEIEEFINNYYHYSKIKISNKPNKNGKYIVDGRSVTVKAVKNNISSLTNEMFEWGVVKKNFDCSQCDSLISLEGAPKEVVDGNFYCYGCKSLKSLEGGPEKVDGDFNCAGCDSLKVLKGSPEKVGGEFRCAYCKSLKSLEGAPKEVNRDFYCYGCKSLTSLEGAPKKVGGGFSCADCNHQWKIEDIKARSEIKGNVFL